MAGTSISDAEVTNVSAHGLWVAVDRREHFLPFVHFPWFADGTIREITTVERPFPGHLRWPLLDVDLSLRSIEDPDQYPLIAKRARDATSPATGSN
jgi:hypothetical protein